MLQKAQREYTFGTIILLVSTLVFLLFLFVYGSVKLLYPNQLSSFDDPYFHARYSALLAEGVESPPLPYVSTMSWWGGGSLYFGYHVSLATLIAVTNATASEERLFYVIKMYHAVAAALVYGLFFWVSARSISNMFPNLNVRTRVSVSLLATVLLPLVFPAFMSRMTFERPFILATIIMLTILHALLERRSVLLFALGLVFPLVYSFTLVACIPLFVYICSSLYTQGCEHMRNLIKPGIVFMSGMALGTLLHPNPIHYIYNAYIVHLVTLVNAATASLPTGGEILATAIVAYDYIWIGIIAAVIVFGAKLFNRKQRKSNPELTFLVALSVVYLPFQILFPRTVEYFGPVVLLTFTLLCLHLFQKNKDILSVLYYKINNNLSRKQQYTLLVAIIIYVGFGSGVNVYALSLKPADMDVDDTRQLHHVLNQYAEDGDRVVVYPFHVFATAYFFSPRLSYSQGINPDFSMLANSSMFWLLHHAVMNPNSICPNKNCNQSEMDIYQVLHDVYGAKFFIFEYQPESMIVPTNQGRTAVPFINLEPLLGWWLNEEDDKKQDQVKPYITFAEQFSSDPRFRILYDATSTDRKIMALQILDNGYVQ